ncbi:MAG: 4Fe-4S dicluster domain-containing protein [Nitrososphaeria archaeon]|nr:4Fe-4S dicluster domain-containing protein [Nitrososphaeria archaeon]NIN52346.1 4Fe-4S dicluster domain-containing protein [Nitrososphaeria archaeon]NIQ32824.1 4Fe-4S dicluster domain-containing protein [Nitrososphaeria archaeon]
MDEKKKFEDLDCDVLDVGLCTSCGTCAGICPIDIIRMNYELDEPEPELIGECNACGLCYEICPGRDVPLRDLDRMIFERDRDVDREPLGIYKRSLRGYASRRDIRESSSSGGVVSALLNCALEEKIIDGALIAGWDEERPWRCKPMIASSPSEVAKPVRTAMVVVPINALLREVYKRNFEKIGVVGCPCHIHALRKMQMYNKPKKLVDSITFMIGLFCAANYYFKGTEHMIKELGKVDSVDEVICMDYRGGKWPGSLCVTTKDGETRYVASKHDYTWHFLGASSYKRDRCLMCVDWSAESADISAGDILTSIPEDNPRWTATLIRTEKGEELIETAINKGYVVAKDFDATVLTSSGLGWEAKKHANMYRLIQRKKYNWPTPSYQYTPRLVPKP